MGNEGRNKRNLGENPRNQSGNVGNWGGNAGNRGGNMGNRIEIEKKEIKLYEIRFFAEIGKKRN